MIDKNAGHWGKLKTPEWELWFTRKELERLLARHCRQVSSRFISYWEGVTLLSGLSQPARNYVN